MKRLIIGLALVVLFGVGQVKAEPIIEDSTLDLWDASQGSVVTAHSLVMNEGISAGSDVSDIRNMFGYEYVGHIEPTNTIFMENTKGFVHWVEWQTSEPITLRSIMLHAQHDGGPIGGGIPGERDANFRGFSRFTLFAEGTPGSFDIQIFELFPSNPYSTTPTPPNAILQGGLQLAANVSPVTSQRFRAEFVQYGDNSVSHALGPRVMELDGYDTFIVIPEPSTLIMLSIGIVVMLVFKRRK